MLRWSTLRARKRMPAAVRNAYRLARHVANGHARPSQPLPSELIDGCRMCASRYALLHRLPNGGRVAELGTDTGAFARRILRINKPAELHLVDLDTSSLCREVQDDDRVSVHVGSSDTTISAFPDDYFAWIYIDADHSFEAVLADAEASKAKVKAGGYLVFNDFAHADQELGRYGVHRAVVEFAIANGWPFAWWAYEPSGLYDVALQRPR